MKDLVLNTSRKSVIHCGAGTFEKYACKFTDKQVFLVTDSNVFALYSPLLESVFKNCAKYVFPAGEESKTPETLFQILKAMLDSGMRRNCTVIAFGGGVVGDIAGLAASLYMRGAGLVQIPTTILAQVDSSVGGKTAVDMCGVKNVLGSFYQPDEVIADPLFFKTLSQREIICGLGEIVKYGALDEKIYYKLIDNTDLFSTDFLGSVVYDCIAYKAAVVERDERDLNGLRKTLNLGHTTGHTLELYYGGKSHGEYVLIGTYYELQIARKKGICAGQYANDLEKLILSVVNEIPVYENIGDAAKLAVYDKKNDSAEISLIVPKRIGECEELKLSFFEYRNLLTEISLRAGKNG